MHCLNAIPHDGGIAAQGSTVTGPAPGHCQTRGGVRLLRGAVLIAGFSCLPAAQAESISQSGTSGAWEQVLRFLAFQDPAVRYATLGTLLLGVACGLLGSFLVVRRMALVGDALSHAVLPGVALGFLWNLSKDPIAIFVGATLAGLLGTFTVSAITRTTRLREDAALGMVLAGFFSVGITLVSRMQRHPAGAPTGIEAFLFGQAAAIGPGDVRLAAVVVTAIVVLLAAGYRAFLLSSFDPGFARVCALPTRFLEHVLLLLLAFAVVVALQAVGVVLVSALLITPAATAYLLTDRFHRMLPLSALLGASAGLAGTFLSFLGPGLPTGPFIVLASSTGFALAFLFAPRRGWFMRFRERCHRSSRIARENTLKAIYQELETDEFQSPIVSFRQLAERRRQTLDQSMAEARTLARHDLATLHPGGLTLTPAGWQKACAIVRNHRLWELYLTHAASIAPDHVHDDAERIEHVLGEDVVRSLERRLGHAATDPHGKPIPGIHQVLQHSHVAPRPHEPSGYRPKD